MMFTFDDFGIESLSFEIRFEPAYLIWDRAGLIWGHMNSLIPELKPQSVQPNQQVLESSDVQLTLELGMLRINTRGPKAFRAITEVGQEFYSAACELIEISTFTRVGYRSIRTKVYRDEQSAMEAANYLAPPLGENALGENSRRASYAVSSRFETESASINVTLKVEKREVAIAVPWDARPYMSEVKQSSGVVFLDCDYATVGVTSRDALNAEVWISQAEKIAKRHWVRFLG